MKRRGDRIRVAFATELKSPGRQLAVGTRIAFGSWVDAWYPIPEPPEGWSLARASRARGTTRFVLPKGWSAVTNGKCRTRTVEDSRVVELWSNEHALSRSFAAAPYRRHVIEEEGLSAGLFLLSEDIPDPAAHVGALSRAIRGMEKRFGPYPFRNFSIAEVPGRIGGFGASSEQGFILVKPRFLRMPGGNLPLFAHEAAHAWWGNTVGAEGPGSLLCTESLAQYGAVIAIEELEGKAAAREFLRFSRPGYISQQCARGYFDVVRRGKDRPLASLRSGTAIGHLLADAKGHWVFHMLRRRVGDERFFGTLRALIARYEGKTLTLAALRSTFVKAAPNAALEQFFPPVAGPQPELPSSKPRWSMLHRRASRSARRKRANPTPSTSRSNSTSPTARRSGTRSNSPRRRNSRSS